MDNGNKRATPRSTGDAFFVHIQPTKADMCRRYGFTKSTSAVATEHPNPVPVGASTDACFSKLSDGPWNQSHLPHSIGTSEPLFDVVQPVTDRRVGGGGGPASHSLQSSHAKPSFYNTDALSAPFDRDVPVVIAGHSVTKADDRFVEVTPPGAAGGRRTAGGDPRKFSRPWKQTSGCKDRSASSASSDGKAILIRGGHVINDDSMCRADVLIKGKKIVQLGLNIQCSDAQVLNAEGKYVMPGGIDPHTHFCFKSSSGVQSVDSFASGTKAALAGGTTMIVNCVECDGSGLVSSFKKWRSEADAQVWCDYGLCVVVPSISDGNKSDMSELVESHGVNSFKFCTAHKGAAMLNDTELYNAFKHCKEIGALARLHAEHGDLISLKQNELLDSKHTLDAGEYLLARPETLEADCAARACSVSNLTNCPLDLVFVMNMEVCDRVSAARKKGQVLFAETTTAAVGVDGTNYFHSNWSHAAAYVTSPPLRADTRIKEAIVDQLASGDLQMVSSGHCAFSTDQKIGQGQNFAAVPEGVTGVEERMMILWHHGVNSGKMDPMRFVAVTSSNAARIFNVYPRKGRIAVDSDADIVIWDPEANKTLSAKSHQSLADRSIFEGLTCVGVPVATILAGKVACENGQMKNAAGSGCYVDMAPFSPLVFSRLLMRDRKVKGRYESIGGQLSNDTNNIGKEFHSRPVTKAGTRNLLDSSFALSGAQVDDSQGTKRLTRVTKPPGGESHGLW